MNPKLTEDFYPDVEPEYEYREVETMIASVNRNDIVGSSTVASSKTGTKWTELFTASGVKICRRLNTDPVTVSRRFETEESLKARERAQWNQGIARNLKDHVHQTEFDIMASTTAKLEECLEVTKMGYMLDYQKIGSLMETQATAKVHANFVQAMVHEASKDDDRDLATLLEEYLVHLKDQLANKYSQRAISRSSNMVSNLMEDVDNSAIAHFIDQAKWMRW